MGTFFLVVSIIAFLISFGITKLPAYDDIVGNPLSMILPFVGGFILAVVAECILIDLAWYWVFLINSAAAWTIGILLGAIYARWFNPNPAFGDVIITFGVGVVALILGAIMI